MNLRFKLYFTLIIFQILQLSVFGQKQYSKKAQAYFNEATFWYSQKQVDKAAGFFHKAISKEKSYFEAYNGLATLAEYYYNFEKANEFYQKSLLINPKQKVIYYKIARNYHILEDYNSAEKTINTLLSKQKHKSRTFEKAEVLKESILLAKSFQKKEFKNKTALSDSINTLNDEYLPTITIDASEIIFTKAYRNSMGIMTEDFFYSRKDSSLNFAKATLLEGPFNTPENEGAICMTADGKTIYYTACGRTDSYGSCDIYKSDLVNNKWTTPVNMGEEINSHAWESQPSISPDGNRLYFVSNRKGGFGNRDIWFVQKNKNNEWSYPINCGANINTTSDEMSPFIHWDNSSFYFASKGHKGIGGYDLFRSEHKVENKRFTSPQNLQFPVNTPLDDNGLVIEQNGRSAYYISEVIQDSNLNNNIFSVELIPEMQGHNTNYLFAEIQNDKNGKSINAHIEIQRLSDQQTVFNAESSYGKFFVCLEENEEYAVFIKKTGYLYYSEHIVSPINTKKWKEIFKLKPLSIGSKIELKNMFFEFDSDKLIDTSQPELERISKLLYQNEKLNIAIIGHTDNQGSEQYNRDLSLRRSKRIKEELNKLGISASRIITEGKGESEPLVPNNTEENQAKNRRTELKIISL